MYDQTKLPTTLDLLLVTDDNTLMNELRFTLSTHRKPSIQLTFLCLIPLLSHSSALFHFLFQGCCLNMHIKTIKLTLYEATVLSKKNSKPAVQRSA